MSTICEYAGDGDVAGVRRALERGVNVNKMDSNRDTPLIWAAWNGQTEVVHVLLEHGADATICDAQGNSPLKLASQQGHTEAARIIRKHLKNPPDPWKRLDDNSVAYVAKHPDIGQSLTSIFNFRSRERLIIARDLTSVAQSMTPATPFDILAPAIVEEALAAFTRLGGQADRGYVLSGQGTLDKPRLKLPARK